MRLPVLSTLLTLSVFIASQPSGLAQGPALQKLDSHFAVQTSNERTTLDRATGELISTVDAALFNLGGKSLDTPLHVVVEIPTGVVHQVQMPGALGGPDDPTYGNYYVDVSAQFPGGIVKSGDRVDCSLTFVHERTVPLEYTLVPYSTVQSNQPPNLSISPLTYSVNEGATLQFAGTAVDPDGDAVTISATPVISNATFSATSGVLSAGTFLFQPDLTQAGLYAVTFTARDEQGLEDQDVVLITVNNVNQAPNLSVPATASVNEGGLLTIQVVADDPDGQGLTITASSVPSNAVFSSATKTLTFGPSFEQAGAYNVSFVADDGTLASSTQTVAITVNDVAASDAGDTNEFTLVVDPAASPTFLAQQKVTGSVNAPGGGPATPPVSMALISGLSPANGEQGETLDVTITGTAAGQFMTHFSAVPSVAAFGPGITVNSLSVNAADDAAANITIDSAASPGPRSVSVSTSNEVAVSVVAFNVTQGDVTLSGTIVDQDTTNGVANALVTVQGTGFSTLTAPDGTFSISGIPPGMYTVRVNPPNHAPFTMQFEAQAGQTFELGNVGTAATVFDPTAPASVSLLSVLGRGVGDFQAPDLGAMKEAIRDTMLLVGGAEAGVLDAFSNQLNSAMSGPGLISLKPIAIDRLAEHTQRGESSTLEEVLFAVSFGLEWTNGPPLALGDWLDGLQTVVNRAWSEPTNPSNYMPIVLFNPGKILSSEPPALSPYTPLNPMQRFLFLSSMLGYAATPAGTQEYASVTFPATMMFADEENEWLGALLALGTPSAYGDPPPPPPSGGDRLYTSYWRGFSEAKNNFIVVSLNQAVDAYAGFMGLMGITVLSAGRSVGVASLFDMMAGQMFEVVSQNLLGVAVASRVPEPPKLLSYEMVAGGRGPAVKVTLQRSPSDDGGSRYLYTLYRFRAFNEGRQLAGFGFVTNGASPIVITDLNPFLGSQFYAATLTHFYSAEQDIPASLFNSATPWWNISSGLGNPAFIFGRHKKTIISDYSDPLVVFVGTPAASVPINDIEVDPDTDVVYYGYKPDNIFEQAILQSGNLGEDEFATFAGTGFASPGHEGLAIDKEGNLYSHNKASDGLFGGRLFRYNQPSGAREHVGQINYYSRLVQFANPVDGQTMDFGPPLIAGNEEDLYVVDALAGQIKRAPVRADFDSYRRTAQSFANLPVSGKAVDMEHDPGGNMYVLIADAVPKKPFIDRLIEKGTMFLPPGAPLKNDCPPPSGDEHVDPVHLFSGEFYENVEDIRIKGRGLDFIWARKYRSRIGTNTVQGNNWDYSYNIFLTTNEQNVVVHDGNTRADEYERDGTNDVWTLREFFRELTRAPDGTLTLEFEDQGKWVFNPFSGDPEQGRIKESVDRYGNTLEFFYDGLGRLERVHDTLDRDITITYNAAGLIDTILDFTGREWTYEYYGAGAAGGNPGDLKAFITPAVTGTPNGNDYPQGKRTEYTYSKHGTDPNLAGNLLTVTDPRGNTYLRNTYASTTDPNDINYDRVVRQVWGNPNDVIDLVYVPLNPTAGNGGADEKTIINDRNGHVKEYFHDAFNRVVSRREYTGRANPGQPTTETSNRPVNRLRSEDPAFFETRYEWNDDSLKTREIHPNGNITEWTYESDLDPSAPVRTRGNIREVRHYPGTHVPAGDQTVIVEQYEYDTSFGRGCCGFNFVSKETDARGNVTRKYYDNVGNLTSVVHRITSAREDFEYNSFGQMTRMTSPDNGSGHRRVDRFDYYTSGPQKGYLQRTVRDEGGLNLTETWEYNDVGMVVRHVDARGHDTLYAVNQLDQVVRQTSVEVTDGSGVRYLTDHYYDANNNVVRSETRNIDANGVLDAANPWITVEQEFEILNNLIRETREVDNTHSLVTEYKYDGNRNTIETRTPLAVAGAQPANVIRTSFDERDLVYRVTEAPGTVDQFSRQFDYDRNGNLVRQTRGLESEPRVLEMVYDGFDRKIEETDPMGNKQEWSFNANHHPVSSRLYGELEDTSGSASNVLLGQTFMFYDVMDRVTNTVQSWFDTVTGAVLGDGTVESAMVWSDNSQALLERDDNGHQVQKTYDGDYRLLTVTDELGNFVTYGYDGNDNILSITETEFPDTGGPAEVFVSTNAYDNLNRSIAEVNNVGNTTQFAYDARNNRRRVTDPRGNVAEMEYDGANRLTRTTIHLTSDGTGAGSPAGEIVMEQAWDDNSRLLSKTDDAGNQTRYTYDRRNRVIEAILPDSTVASTSYDIHSNPIRMVDPNGTVVTNDYDLLNRCVRVDVVPAPGVSPDTTFESYAYDGASRMVRAMDDDSVVERTYDSLSRILTETQNGQVSRSTFDGVGNLLGYEYPGGRVITNAFDGLDRQKTTADGSGLIVTYDFVGPGRVHQRHYANGVTLSNTYDGIKRLIGSTSVRDPGGAAVVLDDWAYTWDRRDNKTSRHDLEAAVVHNYTYDSVDRMVHSEQTGSLLTDYSLDGVGNRTAVTGGPHPGSYTLSPSAPQPQDQAVNQYTTTPVDTRAYDENGNLSGVNTNTASARHLVFDYQNRLVAYSNAMTGASGTYRYDALGRRIRKKVSGPGAEELIFLYDGTRIVEEQNAPSNTVTTYVHGHWVDEVLQARRAGGDQYYLHDDLFNVTKVTDASGNIVEQYEYADYGEPTFRNGAGGLLAGTAIGNRYLFGGREYEPESGWYFYRTRYMDPVVGRFISRDNIGAWGDQKNLGNAFSYAGNNPWSRTDPDGRNALAMAGAALKTIVSSPRFKVYAATTASAAIGAWLYPDAIRKLECGEFDAWDAAKYGGLMALPFVPMAATKASGWLTAQADRAAMAMAQYTRYRRFNLEILLRSEAKIWQYGQFTRSEIRIIQEVSAKHGVRLSVSGSGAETVAGFRNRYADDFVKTVMNDKKLRKELWWRAKKPRSSLIDFNAGQDLDLVLTPEIAANPEMQKAIVSDLKQKLPGWDVGFDYTPAKDRIYKGGEGLLHRKGGALVFDGHNRPERIAARWQLDNYWNGIRNGWVKP